MLKTASFSKIYICCGRTDLRKGIDGLATLVKEQFRMSPFQEDVLFLFCGTRQDRLKVIKEMAEAKRLGFLVQNLRS